MYDSRKMAVLDKLIGTGISAKTEFLRLSPVDLIDCIPDLQANELRILCELQDSVRNNNLFDFLCRREEQAVYE